MTRRELLNAGICVRDCGAPAEPGRADCQPCRIRAVHGRPALSERDRKPRPATVKPSPAWTAALPL
jgi:hypothetical protein